jgi:hypothetical protein
MIIASPPDLAPITGYRIGNGQSGDIRAFARAPLILPRDGRLQRADQIIVVGHRPQPRRRMYGKLQNSQIDKGHPSVTPSLIAVAAGTYCGAVPRRTARRVARPARRAVRRVCRRVIPAVWASASDTGSTVGIAARPNAPTPATVAAFAAASPRRETALRREITPDLISSMTNSRIRTPYAKRFYMNVKLNASMRITLVGAGGKPGWHVKGRAPTWQVRGSIQNGSFRLRQNRPARHRYCPIGRSQRLSNTFFARARSTCGPISFSYA